MSLIDNRKALYNYDLVENFSAGLALYGFEVKSLRAGHGSLMGAYVTIDQTGAWLVGALVSPYQEGNTPAEYDPRRNRQLLLTKSELKRLRNLVTTQGLTVVPISLYNKGRQLKLDIALAKGKKKHDKRQTIKQREADREIDRVMKGAR